jgi:hypothetical protein
MIVNTAAGDLVLADSIRTLSAQRYMLFNQAWAKELGIGADMYAQDGHLARLGPLIKAKDDGAIIEYTHTVMAFTNLTSKAPVSYKAAILATLAVSLGERQFPDCSEEALKATAEAILASGITQGDLEDAVEESKKKFSPN